MAVKAANLPAVAITWVSRYYIINKLFLFLLNKFFEWCKYE